MAFDLSTAQPAQPGGFDLSTAKPVGDDRAARIAKLKAENPAEYDPQSKEWRAKYGAGEPNALARIGRGYMDVGQGIKQLWKGAFGDAGEKEAYTKQVDEEIGRYTRDRTLAAQDRGEDGPGIDWMRGVGNVAATAPAAFIPGGAAAGLGTRMAAGAAGGALSGGAMYTPEGESKAGQVVTGALLGGLAPAAITGGTKLISGGINAGKRAIQPVISAASNNTPEIVLKLQGALSREGIDFTKLSREVQASLLDDAKRALAAGGDLDAGAVARRADIESLGIKPTLGQLTRDPRQWQFERNTAGIQGAGDALTNRFVQQGQQLNQAVQSVSKGIGGKAADDYGAAESALAGLRGADATKRGAVDAAYQAARGSSGRYADLDHISFVEQANNALDSGMLGTYLPAQVRGLLNDVAAGKLPLNVNTATQLDSVLSAAQRGGNPAEAKAIGVIRSALADAPIASAEGEGARAAFDTARGLARDRFAQIENTPALKAALDDVAPDAFFNKYILRGDARDLGQLRKTLETSNPQAWNDVRGQVVDYLQRAANGGNEDGRFSGVAFKKALDKIGPQRLKELFGGEELAQLHTIARAGKALTEQVPLSNVNNSNTASAITNLLQRTSGVPYLRELAAPVKTQMTLSQVGKALDAKVPTSVPPLVGQELQNAISQRGSRVAVPLSVLIQNATNH